MGKKRKVSGDKTKGFKGFFIILLNDDVWGLWSHKKPD